MCLNSLQTLAARVPKNWSVAALGVYKAADSSVSCC